VNVSRHFTLAECIGTQQQNLAEANAKAVTVAHALNASTLAHMVLEPLRQVLGVKVKVTSWYRCPALNSAVGGAEGSEHTTGGAADIVPECDLWIAYEWCRVNPNVGQVIIYLRDGAPAWIHVGIKPQAKPENRELVCYLGTQKKYITYTQMEPKHHA
jgi:hypothetical protein